MTDYNLRKDEFVIMQERGVSLMQKGAREALDEIVLTNLNLILVKTMRQGLFDTRVMLRRCPLASLTYHDDEPQVILGKSHERWNLQAPFDDGVVALSFGEDKRRVATRWADAIRHAAVGDLNSIQTDDAIPQEVADIVDEAKGLFGAIVGGASGSSGAKAHAAPKRASRLSIKCSGCHAPLAGTKGSHVTCPYCDTENSL